MIFDGRHIKTSIQLKSQKNIFSNHNFICQRNQENIFVMIEWTKRHHILESGGTGNSIKYIPTYIKHTSPHEQILIMQYVVQCVTKVLQMTAFNLFLLTSMNIFHIMENIYFTACVIFYFLAFNDYKTYLEHTCLLSTQCSKYYIQ